MDLVFSEGREQSPIKSEADLDLYGARVAGTVALLCIQLVLHHCPGKKETEARRLMAAGHDMGIALQYTNIARDLAVDAEMKRCYVPSTMVEERQIDTRIFVGRAAKVRCGRSAICQDRRHSNEAA
ncbi:hypothetical protein MRB53_041230 [Persea americana]|nr:hypothetical protein MRB53_041230 [Persea americana]